MQKVYFKEIDKIIKNYLSSSEFDIKVAVAWITDTKILKALEGCLDRGVSVNIIFYKDRINKIDLFENLYKKGAIINYTTSLMHNKFCVIDRRIVINGSYNWTHSAKSNSENIQVTESTIISKQFLDEFNKILYKSKKADEYFIDHEEKFKEYLDTIIIPERFPVLYKEEIDNTLKVTYYFYPTNFIHGDYSIYNISIPKDSIVNNLNHIYLTFNNLEDFLYHQRSLYNILHTNKRKDTIEIKKFSHLIIDEKRLELGYIIDFIDESTLRTISDLSIEKYSTENIKFCDKKVVFLDKSSNTHYLFFSIDAYTKINYYKELKDLRITINSLPNLLYYKALDKIPFNKINYFKPNKVFYASIQADIFMNNMSYNSKKNPLLDLEQVNRLKIFGPILYEYKFILDTNFLFAYEHSKNYNHEIEKFLIEKKIREREESYKRDLAERLERDEFKKKEKENTQSCYIATMIYNDINHPNVERLRNFRDEVLLLNTFGKIFVKYYYKISPWVVEKFGRYKLLHIVAKSIIEKIILEHIKSKY